MIINKFEITGFWGRAIVRGKVHPDVTIFIGVNGTGKTTLINLLVAALRVDTQTLESIPFEKINITLKRAKGKGRAPSLSIERVVTDRPYTIFKYTIRDKTYRIYADTRRRRVYRRGRIVSRLPAPSRRYEELRNLLDELVQISWISVYRHSPVESREDERRRFNVDRRVDELTDDFTRYQLRLETMVRERAHQFQRDVMLSLLYSKELDDLSNFRAIRQKIRLEDKQKEDLLRAFDELGITGKKPKIEQHFKEIRKAMKNITDVVSSAKKVLTLSDISPLPFATRTQRIVELLKASERDKDLIRDPIRIFLEVLHGFINNKKFEIEEETGELVVSLTKLKKKRKIELSDLSSGEKQLLIQLLECLLQEKHPMIFFADEPELSLHVEWQEKLLPALRRLNPNSQIVVATHSPDIVSKYGSNVIDMEDIIIHGF